MADSLTREQRAMLEGMGRSAAEMLGKKPTPSLKVARGYIAEAGDHTYDVLMPDGAVLEEVPCLVSALGGTAGDEVRVEWVQGRALVTGVVATADNASYVSLVPYLSSGFEAYGTAAVNTPHAIRRGYCVTIAGAVTPKSSIDGGTTDVLVMTLPELFRPAFPVRAVNQGSSINRWMLGVDDDGSVMMSRYGTSSYAEVPAGAWLPIFATYVTG